MITVFIREEVREHILIISLVPRQGVGAIRGRSMGPAGMFHDPEWHNEVVHGNPMAMDQVNTGTALNHQKYMNCNHTMYNLTFSVILEL